MVVEKNLGEAVCANILWKVVDNHSGSNDNDNDADGSDYGDSDRVDKDVDSGSSDADDGDNGVDIGDNDVNDCAFGDADNNNDNDNVNDNCDDEGKNRKNN